MSKSNLKLHTDEKPQLKAKNKLKPSHSATVKSQNRMVFLLGLGGGEVDNFGHIAKDRKILKKR